jgi:hypothetical protein
MEKKCKQKTIPKVRPTHTPPILSITFNRAHSAWSSRRAGPLRTCRRRPSRWPRWSLRTRRVLQRQRLLGVLQLIDVVGHRLHCRRQIAGQVEGSRVSRLLHIVEVDLHFTKRGEILFRIVVGDALEI